MKLTLEATSETRVINGVACRVWNAVTEGGVKCYVMIHLIAVARTEDNSQFEAELLEIHPRLPISIRHVQEKTKWEELKC